MLAIPHLENSGGWSVLVQSLHSQLVTCGISYLPSRVIRDTILHNIGVIEQGSGICRSLNGMGLRVG